MARTTLLMHLEPALSSDAPLRLTFIQVKLSKTEASYAAISYTWGGPRLIYPIYVDDDTHVLVTQNLDRALRRLRYSNYMRILWADAICINQNDHKEKEIQICQSSKIELDQWDATRWAAEIRRLNQ
jgi:hypothetical protein